MSKPRNLRKAINYLFLFVFIAAALLLSRSTALAQESDQKQIVHFDALRSDGSLQGSKAIIDSPPGMSIANVTGSAKVIVDKGNSINRIDIVFLGDGYQESELGKYSTHVSTYANGLVSQEPFLEYNEYFNMHRVDIASTDSGIDNDGARGIEKDTVLDSEFWCQGNQTTLCTNVSKAWNYAALARDFDHILVLVNSSSTGSAAYPFSDLSVVSALQPDNVNSVIHQLGHSFGNLADEYDSGAWPTYTGFEPAEANVSAQNTSAMQQQNLKWVKWLGKTAFGSLIGTHEGAMGHKYSIYRPTLTSKMRELKEPFNAPSVENIIKEIYRKVKPIDDATVQGQGFTGQNTFFVKPMKTRNSTVKVQWFIDGAAIPNATSDTFRPDNYPLSNGKHTVTARVQDETTWVKDEAFRSLYMTESRNWEVTIDQNAPVILQHPTSITRYPGETANFAVDVSGQDISLQWFRNGEAIPGATGKTISVVPVKREHSQDKFWVVITNVAGSIRSNTAVLTVGNRLPTYAGITSINTFRDTSVGFSFSVADDDKDTLTVTAALDAAGQSSGAKVALLGNQLDIRTGPSYLGSFVVNLTISDQISEIKQAITVSVKNRAPTIKTIPYQNISWRNDFINISLEGSDPDPMDVLTYSAQLDPKDVGNIQLSVAGNVLKIDPKQNYIGQFVVTARVSDGMTSSETQFVVSWQNGAPILAPISDQRMFYKRDFINVPLAISDPDGDVLTTTAKIVSGSNLIAVSVNNGILIINPPALFQGVAQISVSVNDTNLTVSRTFNFEAYNSKPVIEPIVNQKVSPQKREVRVPFKAYDPDPEDELVLNAALVNGPPTGIPVSIEGAEVVLKSNQPFPETLRVKLEATDGNKNTEVYFDVKSSNSKPILSDIPAQLIHPIVEDKREIILNATDEDGDILTYSAKLVDPSVSSLVSIEVTDNKLTIDPIKDYLGEYYVHVEASDGNLSSSKLVKIQTYNNLPELTPICDRFVASSSLPFKMDVKSQDQDGEKVTLRATVEYSNLAYNLNQKYNFSLEQGVRSYDVYRKKEKYLRARVNSLPNSLVFITPDGNLYLTGESFETSTLLEKLHPVFYADPSLLVGATLKTGTAPVSLSFEGGQLILNSTNSFEGTLLVRIKGHDYFGFDEKNFILGISGRGGALIGDIETIRSHWTEKVKTVAIPYLGNGNGSEVTVKKASFNSAIILDRQYQFISQVDSIHSHIPEGERPKFNQTNRQEKYFVGVTKKGTASNQPSSAEYRVYAILPNGKIYYCPNQVAQIRYTINNSSYVGQVEPIYYHDLDLLMNPPNESEQNVSLTKNGLELSISTTAGYIGKSILEISAGSGYGNTKYVIFDKYNTAPEVTTGETCSRASQKCAFYSWRTKEIVFPIYNNESDKEDVPSIKNEVYLRSYGDYNELYSYDLRPDNVLAERSNLNGWKEVLLTGLHNGQRKDFAILPTGGVYANWAGSPVLSELIGYVKLEAYHNPTVLDGRHFNGDNLSWNKLKDSKVYIKDGKVVLNPPDDFRSSQEGIRVVVKSTDGLSVGEGDTIIALANTAPVLTPLPDVQMHWRETRREISYAAQDVDGIADIPNLPSLAWSNMETNGNPGRLQFQVQLNKVLVDISNGIPRSFRGTLQIQDELQAADSKQFNLNIVNATPSFDKVGDQVFIHTSKGNTVEVKASDADSLDKNNLKVFVHPLTPDEYAGNIVSQFKLKQKSVSLAGSLGSFEHHLTGEINGEVKDFVLFPTGVLYLWNGSLANSELVAILPSHLCQTVNYLLNLKEKATSPVKTSVSSNKITFERNGATISPAKHKFTIWVSDGMYTSYESIDVSWLDRPPVLPSQLFVTGHWRNGPLKISGFDTVDQDGDAITYELISKTNTGYGVRLIDGALEVTPKPGSALNHVVEVRATSTNLSTATSYVFSFTNQAPIIQSLSAIGLGYKESVSMPLKASDPNNDPVSISVGLSGGVSSNYKVTFINGILDISPVTPKPGLVTVSVSASDTVTTVTDQFTVNFVNRAPKIEPLSSISMKWTEQTRNVPITVSDPDGDTLTLSAYVDKGSEIATTSFNGKTLVVNLLKYVPHFNVRVIASDGHTEVETLLTVLVSNLPPQIIAFPTTRSVHWRTDSFSIPVSSTDLDGDKITLDAKLVDTGFPAIPKIVGSELVVDLPAKILGKFIVEVGASDGAVRTSARIAVQVVNQIPRLGELSNVIISKGNREHSIDLEPTDPDNDPITVAARLVTPSQVAYELNSIHNFYVAYANFNFNKLGNAEKYLKGRRVNTEVDSEYVIYPSGRMYLWTGTLSKSTYLGTVPNEFYLDPRKLVGAQQVNESVANVRISLSGNLLKVTPDESFTGTAWVYASVNDTKDTSGIFFSITLEDEGSYSESDQCKSRVEIYDGEYRFSGKTSFIAEGRVGDSSENNKKRTHELSLSKSGQGPFHSGENVDYEWKSGGRVSFTLTYDPEIRVANFTVNGTSVRHSIVDPIQITDVIIRAKRASQSSTLTLSDLKLNGSAINSILAVSDYTSPVKNLRIRSISSLGKKFTLEGKIEKSFVSGIKDSDLAFQISFGKGDNAPSNCEGTGDGDDGSAGDGSGENNKKVQICHIPGGDMTKAKTISVGKSALEAHLAHGDVVGACPGQPNDPGDPSNGGPTCEHKKVFSSPNYTLWNSFLGMANILELTNGTTKDIAVKISFYSIHGSLAHQRTVNVPAHNQFDVIINDFPNFIKDSYGIVKLEFEGNLDGRMSFYRPSSDGAGFDYAYAIPLIDATFGTTAVGFNTFQPSTKLEEVNNLVANWLSIVNLDSVPRVYTIFSYNTAGTLVMRREVEVSSFGRADIDGGHGIVGPNVVGFHKIVPKTLNAEYIAQLTRFGGDAPAGFAPSKYKFAVPLNSNHGQSDPIYMPISNKFGQANWIEVVNILDKPVGASINYYSQSGRLLESVDAQIRPNAQLHFNASGTLPQGDTGYAVVVPFEPFSIIAQSMGYLKEGNTGSITSVYGAQARRAVPCTQSGSYNLFINMQNWLLVSNTTNETIHATVLFTGPNSAVEKSLVLPARASTYINIHSNPELRTNPNTYGLISVYPKDSSKRLFSEVLRLRYKPNGDPDFSMPVPVR